MSRSPRHRLARWLVAMLLIGSGLPAPAPIAADEIVLVPTPLLRKFPAFDFCPFPIELPFVSTGDHATVFVSANTFVFDTNIQQFVYTHQAIDDIVVVRDSIQALHRLPNDLNSSFHPCYAPSPDNTVPFIFAFDQLNPGDARYIELFDSGSPPVGWDLTQGAYYDNTRSGPVDPSVGATGGSSTAGVGCLGLGSNSLIPALTDTARSSVLFGDLIGGKAYVLNGWWSVDEGISTNQVTLTIKIVGPNQTTLAQKTWGSIKARYR